MSCLGDIFMVWAKKRKTVMVGEKAIIRSEWWDVSSWAELCMMCNMRMSYVRG